MNYLAHLFLSGPSPESIIGNLAADTIKGRVDPAHPLAEGIRLHRAVDAFHDGHPMTGRSRRRLEPRYRHLSRIIVDVFADHLLARNWSRWSVESLDSFAERMYRVVDANLALIPVETRDRFARMSSQDWLRGYCDIRSVRLALRGITNRLSHKPQLEEAVTILESNLDEFAGDFDLYFADIVLFVKSWSGSARE